MNKHERKMAKGQKQDNLRNFKINKKDTHMHAMEFQVYSRR